jgi:hypothetical protein
MLSKELGYIPIVSMFSHEKWCQTIGDLSVDITAEMEQILNNFREPTQNIIVA